MTYEYDAGGNVASVRDEMHTTPNTRYAYDTGNRLKTVTQTLDEGTAVTAYDYDRYGNLTAVTDPNGNATSYVYDDFGQMLSQQSPVTGTSTYAYDAAGNLISSTDANLATTTRTYDALGRVTSALSVRSGQETEAVSWTFDGESFPFSKGRLTMMTDPSGSTAYRYDRRGLLLREDRTILGNAFVQTYGYDADGNRTAIGYPSGRVVTYGLDHAGRPLTVTGVAGGVTTSYVTGATYLPYGPATSLTLGSGGVETRTHDAHYQPLMAKLARSGTTLAEYHYTTDARGNITAIADATSASYNRTFGYDDLNRLVTANGPWGTGSYTYDRMGNMLTSTLGSQQRTFTYEGTTPKLTTAYGITMQYDSAGNELKTPAGQPPSGSSAVQYSSRNHLSAQLVRDYDRCEPGTSCVVADPVEEWMTHAYDGRGVRVRSLRVIAPLTIGLEDPPPPESPNHYFYTPELSMLNVVSPTTGRTAEVIWFGGRPVADHDGTTVRDTFTDHLGTPVLQTSPAGTIVWRVEHAPYGTATLRAGAAADDQPLRFPGQQVSLTNATGEENYNIFRWYRAGWGRYTQNDPIDWQGTVNPYSYSDENPLRNTDPDGRAIIDRQCVERIGGQVQARHAGEGREDAIRHCVWNCRMTRECSGGRFGAWLAAEAYEIGVSQIAGGQGPDNPNSEMDRHNNRRGRNCAFRPGACESLCTRMAESGGLITEPPPWRTPDPDPSCQSCNWYQRVSR